MIRAIIERFRQKERTANFPKEMPQLPPRFRGVPVLSGAPMTPAVQRKCPCGALSTNAVDLGKCVFCGRCEEFSAGVVKFGKDFSLAATSREALVYKGGEYARAKALGGKLQKMFGRSLRLRQVSAGGCGACEADANVLLTPVYDMARFGIQFVASPRHADGLLITGPVTRNMLSALHSTYEAVPAPKIVIACGACAISGGTYAGHDETAGIPKDIPVDLYVPGCPPHPYTLLDGLLRLLGRI
jgi:Ni,Fe-hydrogenase III small subunit